MSVSEEILSLYGARGADAYFGESVSMIEHALQAAHFARRENAPRPLILAALLHDVGHLLEAVPDDVADWKIDARHEEIGARWLAARFPAEVSEPVRLHVPAKRYLCATDAGYFAMLSAASVATLKLQGGPMSARESAEFETKRFYQAAVRVRRCDDQGKQAGLKTAGLAEYAALIEELTMKGRPADS